MIGTKPIETRYPPTISYVIRRCEFDDFLLRRSGARVLGNTRVTSIRRHRDRWVINDELEPAVERLKAIVLAERARVRLMRPVAEAITDTFRKPS